MNPGKVVDPYPHRPRTCGSAPTTTRRRPTTHFRFPDDDGSFARAAAALRRRRQVPRGTRAARMCPSYMVTREEKHSTRGRAHLLFEMLRGDAICRTAGATSAVSEALDLCLACKGCKSDCPVNVDMATYKAEFLSHYYAGPAAPAQRLRDGPDPLVGAAGVAARRGSPTASRRRPASRDARQAGGRHRAASARMPRFAPQTFRAWFAGAGRRPRPARPRGAALARHLQQPLPPETREAAVEVLEARRLPGAIPRAAALLRPAALRLRHARPAPAPSCREILDALGRRDPRRRAGRRPRAELRRRLPRRAASNLFPDDEDARRLDGQTLHCSSEFLDTHAPDFAAAARSRGKALVHGHCHHKAVIEPDARRGAARPSSGSTSRCSTPAAAAWPARSASRPSNYEVSMARAASACCCPRVRAGRRRHADRRRRLQLPRADRADDRTRRRCTWPRSLPGACP